MKKASAKKAATAGVYIHVPFCQAKCNYCDFNSFSNKGEITRQYFSALKEEISTFAQQFPYKMDISSVFIGGGTPSLVSPQLVEDVLCQIKGMYNLKDDAEITLEVNPGTVNMEKLCIYRKVGINRLSIGLQAWQTELLTFLGRIHDAKRFIESYKLARMAGFENINVDLIFGIPTQKMEDWVETLEKVVELGPEHISAYGLKIEEGTPLAQMRIEKTIEEVNEDLEREMYYFTNSFLKEKGYSHYEISNYAKNKFQSKHNIMYWKCEDYVGFGAGSHSYFNAKRYANISLPEDYIEAVNSKSTIICETEDIDKQEQMDEYMMLGLRMTEGVNEKEFYKRFKKELQNEYGERIGKLIKQELLVVDKENIRLTQRGLDFANRVFLEFV